MPKSGVSTEFKQAAHQGIRTEVSTDPHAGIRATRQDGAALADHVEHRVRAGQVHQNLDGAQKYLKFIMQDEPNLAFPHAIPGVCPVTKSVATSPRFADAPILKQ